MESNKIEYLTGPFSFNSFYQKKYLEDSDGTLIMSDHEYLSHGDYNEWQTQQNIMKLEGGTN